MRDSPGRNPTRPRRSARRSGRNESASGAGESERVDAKQRDVGDLGLAEKGRSRIEWADGQMPVLRGIRERFAQEKPLKGLRLAACLHVTSETANLVSTLTAGGATVRLCASNPLSTQDEVAASLRSHGGIEVFAIRRQDNEADYRHIVQALEGGPHLTMDDGADLVSFLHSRMRDLLPGVI